MKKDDAEEYTQSLGQIVAGSWRQIALAKRLGVPKALGQSVEDWVNHRLGGYVKQSISERREAAKELADEGESTRAIADVLGVDEKTIRNDKTAENSAPEENKVEEKQDVTKETAENSAPEPLDTVTSLAADEAIRAKAAETENKKESEEVRAEKIESILSMNEVLPTKEYNVIYADPPWRYDYSKSDSRKIENHYPTMSLDEIKDLAVPAAEDCVLFMWATSPKLPQAMEVLDSWGFVYRTCAIWDKQKIGMGYYFRQQHEFLLLAAKGNVPVPAPENRVGSVFSFPRGEHSSKPIEVYAMIDTMYPEYSKSRIELFCRTPQQDWDAWGNQSETA